MDAEARKAAIERPGTWRVANVRCRFCDHRWKAVFPEVASDRSLECPKCHLTESEVVEEIEA